MHEIWNGDNPGKPELVVFSWGTERVTQPSLQTREGGKEDISLFNIHGQWSWWILLVIKIKECQVTTCFPAGLQNTIFLS